MHDLWQARPRTRVSSSSMVACPLICWGALACWWWFGSEAPPLKAWGERR
ncbi:unnamed protein product [Ectocarpus sp. 8 AP-2014]